MEEEQLSKSDFMQSDLVDCFVSRLNSCFSLFSKLLLDIDVSLFARKIEVDEILGVALQIIT